MRIVATVLAIGAGVLLAAGCGTATHVATPAAVAAATVSGVQFAYPTAFHIRRFSSCNRDVTGDLHGACVHGVVVASYALRAQPERGGFQHQGVAFELYRQPADQKAGGVRLGDRRLALWPFRPIVHGGMGPPLSRPLPPEQYSAWLRVGDKGYWALAWVGSQATARERHALANLIRSVHATGVTPHQALPLPPRQVVHVLCGGSPGNPRVPSDTLEADYGRICAQVTGSKCRVWTQAAGAPVSAIRERHYHLAASFCAYTHRFLIEHPRGYVVEPRPSHLALR